MSYLFYVAMKQKHFNIWPSLLYEWQILDCHSWKLLELSIPTQFISLFFSLSFLFDDHRCAEEWVPFKIHSQMNEFSPFIIYYWMTKLYAFIILIAMHIFGCLIHIGQSVSVQILSSTNTQKGNLALRTEKCLRRASVEPNRRNGD